MFSKFMIKPTGPQRITDNRQLAGAALYHLLVLRRNGTLLEHHLVDHRSVISVTGRDALGQY